MTHTEACIALNLVPKVGPVRLRKLLEIFETPGRILLAKPGELTAVEGIGRDIAENIAGWQEKVDLDGELKRIEQAGVKIITQESPLYPRELRTIYNPPIVLYVLGELLERDHHALGVVGSRQTSHYGLECAKKLSYQIAYAGVTIVSGLARGIDTAAHQGALAAQGRTIAVVGSGLNKLYPPENKALAEKIAGSGAVVSEYPMERAADTQTFPYRNRIVSGWGFGVLVVEAGANSGALITASQAVEQGRGVFAVPGPIDRPTSAGSNRLIQQGAKLVTNAADILDEMNVLFRETPKFEQSQPRDATMTEHEKAVYEAIGDSETPIDAIIAKCRLPTGVVSSSLLALEMKRLVKQLPGQHFVKLL